MNDWNLLKSLLVYGVTELEHAVNCEIFSSRRAVLPAYAL